ncbi:MAG: radical SAM protein [Planctomycetota bacterium]
MRVLFIYPVPRPSNKIYTGYHAGIASLAAVLKERGHEPSLRIVEDLHGDWLLRDVDRLRPDCIALSVASPQMRVAERILAILAQSASVPVLVGGVGVTVEPGRLLASPNVLAEIHGEGEQALPAALDRLGDGGSLSDIPNVSLTADAPPPYPLKLVEDLDSLPFGLREIFPYQEILDYNRPNVGLEMSASRGCPFGCGYCANETLNRLTASAGVRLRSPANVTAEIRHNLDRYANVSMVGFHDDIFGLDKDWLREFAERYRRDVGLPFWCNLRVGTFTDAHLAQLREAGCFRVHLGVESGSERIRREILDRPFRNRDISDAFRSIREAGLRAVAFFMLGLPEETEADIRETVALAREIRPDWSVVSLFTPYPGTRLAKRFPSPSGTAYPETYYDETYVFEGAGAPPDVVRRYYRDFASLVYGRPERSFLLNT